MADNIYAFSIKNQWLNMSLYFINFMYKTKRNPRNNEVCNFITVNNRLSDDNRDLGGGQRNTKWLANGASIKTDFIKLDKTDIISFFEQKPTGFSLRININELNNPGNYKRKTDNNGESNITNQERFGDNASSTVKNNNNILYFLKGTNSNDVIRYIISANVI